MTEREILLRRISSYDFAVTDIHIYLDTHPDDKNASKMLKEYEKKSCALRDEYEKKFGPLMTSGEGGNRYAWISDPWPWNVMED